MQNEARIPSDSIVASLRVRAMGLRPVRLIHGVPFAGEVLECDLGGDRGDLPPLRLFSRWVLALAKQLLLSGSSLPGLLKADVRVWADREELLLAGDLIAQAPDLASCRRDGEVEPAAVGQLVGLLGRLALRICMSVSGI